MEMFKNEDDGVNKMLLLVDEGYISVMVGKC